MRIGFFVQGLGPHWTIAKYLIESAKKVMPSVPVFQLTDAATHECVGIDGIVRLGGEMPMAVRRMTLHSMLGGDWLFVDTDVVIRKDVSHVFKDDFDIALTDRVGSIEEFTPYGRAMPFNTGVSFSRCPEFWAEAAKHLKTLPAKFQEWEGDQHVIAALHDGYATAILPGRIYNFSPNRETDSVKHAAICHFKGKRKQFLGSHGNYY